MTKRIMTALSVVLVGFSIITGIAMLQGRIGHSNATVNYASAASPPTTAPPDKPSPPVVPAASTPKPASISDYATKESALSNELSQNLAAMSASTTNPHIADPTWKAQTVATAEALKNTALKAHALPLPPSCLVQENATFIRATDMYVASTSDYIAGVNTLDVARLQAGLTELQAGTEYINQATAQLNAKPCG